VLLDCADHDLSDALADQLDLSTSSIRGGTELARHASGEADHEETEEVIILGLNVDVSLDGGLPLADERAQLVPGDVHAVEVGEAGGAFDVLHHQSDLPVALLSTLVALLEVSETGLDDAALQSLAGNL
jgi:hypothetical protein